MNWFKCDIFGKNYLSMKRLLILSLLTTTSFSFGQDCTVFIDWQYEQEVYIDNLSPNQTITDCQVELFFDTDILIQQGKMMSNGEDIRFIDENCQSYFYWVEGSLPSTQTKIWVRIDEILPNTTKTIRMIYGNNQAASMNNGDSTFLFFDDFGDGNLNKWTVVNNGVATSVNNSGELVMNTSAPDVYTCLYSNLEFGPGVALHYSEENINGHRYHTSSGLGWDPNRGRLAGGYHPSESVGERYDHDSGSGYFFTSNADIQEEGPMFIESPDNKKVEIRYQSDSCSLFNDNIFKASSFISIPSTSIPVYFWQNGWDGVNSSWTYDSIFVRRLILSEFSIDIMDEQELSFCSDTLITSQPLDNTVLVNGSAIFSVTTSITSATYQWQMDNGTGFMSLNNAGQYNGVDTEMLTVSNVTLSQNNTLFRCIVTENSNCSDTTDVAVLFVVDNSGIEDISKDILNIYPNPTSNLITIQSETPMNNTFRIYDQQGREVMNGKLKGKNTEVSLGELSRGTYTIQVDGNYKTAVIIKE